MVNKKLKEYWKIYGGTNTDKLSENTRTRKMIVIWNTAAYHARMEKKQVITCECYALDRRRQKVYEQPKLSLEEYDKKSNKGVVETKTGNKNIGMCIINTQKHTFFSIK